MYVGTTNPPTTLTTTITAPTTTYTASLTEYNTPYYWYVVPTNGGSDAVGCTSAIQSFTSPAAPAPPANDECSNAVLLTANSNPTCVTPVSGTTLGATQSMVAGTCSGTPNDDVWYSFVATSTTHIVTLSNIVSVGNPSSTDMYFQVMSNACGGAVTSLLCSDPNSGTVSGLTVGATYYIRVYTYSATVTAAASFNICVTAPPPPPANDDCANAVVLIPSANSSCISSVAGSTWSATSSGNTLTPCTGTADDDVWYSFVATSTTHNVMLSNIVSVGATSSTSLYLQVLSGSCAGLTSVMCDTTGTTPTALTGLTVGNTYYVRVYNSNAGTAYANTFNICIVTPVAPINDNCATAIPLVASTTTTCAAPTAGTTLAATSSGVAVAPCTGTTDDDVWYSFVATNPSHIITLSNIISVGTGTNSTSLYLQAFSGVCGTLASILCDTSAASAAVLTGLTIGNTYYLRVYNSNGTGYANSFDICVTSPPPPPVNNGCAGALAITPGATFSQNAITASNLGATTDGTPQSCVTDSDNNVWFTVQVPASGNITIETAAVAGSPFIDSVLNIYSGACGSLVEVPNGCNDDIVAGVERFSRVALTGLTPNSTLYISVLKWIGTGSEDGQFKISAYDSSLSTSEVASGKNVTVYPNPFNEVLYISDVKNVASVIITDVSGRTVKTITKPTAELQLGDLTAGMYLVTLKYKDGSVKTMKAIKK
ncbi:T9SS type A sorting domain-containing protein [Chryseobacterium sp.]|uniref:T9SS type A sorting domain-containing protein n=1 Tax=Chryseobacterium sp. TaxID=1871047 RepID=UPI001E5B134D|nr:T9SS type A sorting domain-containing protein [Chryseobacterium sp.]